MRCAGAVMLLMLAVPGAAQEAVVAVPKPGAPKVAAKAEPAKAEPAKGITPNAERIVTIGAINKRTGETRTFVGKPGEMFEFGGLRVIVRACEMTPPWEQKLTGAFLLIDERLVRGGARRVFSGWMFAESPSLHPLESPRYDIWVKSCTMRFPETGPDTVVAARGEGEASASKAKKSAVTPSAAPN